MNQNVDIIRLPLSQGIFALIDKSDYELAGKRKWSASRSTDHGRFYVTANFGRDPVTGKKKWYSLHRFIMGAKKGQIVDHINGDTLDNRRSNLRFCTQQENLRNRRQTRGKQYKGVFLDKRSGMFYVDIRVGSFKTAREAAIAYNNAASKIFDTFFRGNIIEDEKQ